MEQLPQVGFMKSFVLFWKNYVNFKGRSRRSEYWYMMLWHLIFILPAFFVFFIINLFLFFISIAADNETLIVMSILMIILTSVYTFVYSLATFIPNLAL
ncbi:DUF805 domain-containing protein, partial [Staphylococcus aureus]|nr:DUF805 domain-containing protein [Staphylococcus aureus]